MCYRRYPYRHSKLHLRHRPSCVREHPDGTHNLHLPAPRETAHAGPGPRGQLTATRAELITRPGRRQSDLGAKNDYDPVGPWTYRVIAAPTAGQLSRDTSRYSDIGPDNVHFVTTDTAYSALPPVGDDRMAARAESGPRIAVSLPAMWPEEQPPGGEQNPQDPHHPQQAQVPPHNPYQQAGYQQPNPYQQPGYQQTGYPQPNPYTQPPQHQPQPAWGAPAPTGAPQPPSDGGGNRTKATAIVAAIAVVITAGVTGFLVLGGDKDEQAGAGDKDKRSAPASTPASESADPGDSASASAPATDDNPRDSEAEQPTVAGWKVVVNPKWGTAFDVPAGWEVKTPGTLIGFEETDAKADTKPIITMSAPAYYKPKWCVSDDDKDGRTSDTALAAVGTKGASGARNADEVALNQVPWWVYGGYTQPDKKSLVFDEKATPYTTKSGIKGSFARAHSKNTPQKGKCASDGKAITFGFKNSAGDYVAWSLYGATGVTGEVSDKTIMQILSTVRLHGDPTGA